MVAVSRRRPPGSRREFGLEVWGLDPRSDKDVIFVHRSALPCAGQPRNVFDVYAKAVRPGAMDGVTRGGDLFSYAMLPFEQNYHSEA